jgi:adenylate cyclase
MERRLAAILAADVVGYSALMERDETGTFERLKAHREELFELEIERRHGRIFKLMGDGLLAEFTSVVDAVETAVSLQRGMAERNAALPSDQRIDVRIGINLGEVIVDGPDRYGDGVNIAARLQQLADPGGICISDKVAREVDTKLAYDFEPMGRQRVKNITEPIPVHRVKLDETRRRPRASRRLPLGPMTVLATAILTAAAGAAALFLLSENPASQARPPAVAVLPLANMSGDPALQYFADGTTETLVSYLARSPEIRAIAYTSSNAYKGKSLDVRRIGAELGARFLVEGSVQRTAERMRITAQLIDADSGDHVWAERYDREGTDALAMQDEVATRIVATIAGTQSVLKRKMYEDAWGADSSDLDEYTYYLRGHELHHRMNQADGERAIEIWEEGLRKFPNSALLKVKLGFGYYQRVFGGWSADIDKDYQKAAELVREGLSEEKVPALTKMLGHFFFAFYNLEYKRDFDEAVRERDITLALAPSDLLVICNMAVISAGAGDPDHAIAIVTPVEDLRSDFIWASPQMALGRAYFVKGDYGRAAAYLKQAPGDAASSLPFLAASYAEMGRAEEARAIMDKARAQLPSLSVALMRRLYPNRDETVLVRQDTAMRKAGLPDG